MSVVTMNNKISDSVKNDSKKLIQNPVVAKTKGKIGEWCRHRSSTGKDYYFHVITHASQWEKPKEWLEFEKKHGLVPGGVSTPVKAESKPQQHQQSYVSSGAAEQQQQQSQPQIPLPERNQHNRNREEGPRYFDHRFHPSSTSNMKQSLNNSHHSVSSSVTSSDHVNYHGHSSQDNFRHSTSVGVRRPSEDLESEDMDISPSDSNTSTHSNHMQNSRGGRTNSRNHHEGSNSYQRDNNYTTRDQDPRNHQHRESNNRSRARERNYQDMRRERSRSGSRLRDERSRSPWENDSERKDGEGMGHLGSVTSLSTVKSLDSEVPTLSASLALYYRGDLIQHVLNLPGEAMESQANKVNDDVLTQAAISLSKVSTELKMARSRVRLTDIQSTLSEQRILFLREQMTKLEQADHPALMGLGNDE